MENMRMFRQHATKLMQLGCSYSAKQVALSNEQSNNNINLKDLEEDDQDSEEFWRGMFSRKLKNAC